jgi:hypothetical protein
MPSDRACCELLCYFEMSSKDGFISHMINPLTPELNPSAQRCLPRFFIGDFNF